uniref:Vacuolar protein sorting-associated protein 16 homolog n=2 Tax=Onchocerca TaxID=6281 RepID=A0A8R1Y1P4_ONCVO
MKFETSDWKYLNPVKIRKYDIPLQSQILNDLYYVASEDVFIFIRPKEYFRNDTLFQNTGYDISDKYLFVSSPYGGSIAIAIPDTSFWNVMIKTNSGKILSTFKAHNVHSMYWTRCHRLVIVNIRGRVLVYTPLGKLKYQFIIDEEITVTETRIYYGGVGNTGLAVLSENNRIYAVNSVMEAVPWRIPDIAKANHPSAWNVLTSLQVTILFVIGNAFYAGMQGVAPHLLDLSWKIDSGEYTNIVPNWDSSRIALLHSSFVIQIIDSDFSLLSTLSLRTVGDAIVTSSLTWCGSEVLALKRSRQSLYLISLCSETHIYDFENPVEIDMELDGIKVFTTNELVFLSQVPDAVDSVLGVASPEPGAILYEASEKLIKGTYGVYEYIHMIEDQMEKAVQQCLVAAAHQFDTTLQKKMLKAASLGKSLLRRQDASQFVEICRVMRVLNFLRKPYIGMALSFAQSEELKMSALTDRLTDLGQWPSAISISKYMKVPSKNGIYRILAHWALEKIEMAKAAKEIGKMPDFKALSEMIVSKFTNYPEVSFADVAMKAAGANLNELAELLLDRETCLNRQVEMLMKLNKIDRALAKAAKSQQPDLLHYVLTYLKRTQKKEVIDHLVLKLPQALCLYQDYLKEEAPRHLLALYVQKDDFARQSLYYLKESESTPWNPFDNKDKVEGLLKAKMSLNKLKEYTTAQLAAETAELFSMCETLDGKPGFSDVDRTSIRCVYMWAVGHQEDNLAELIKKKFKLTEKANKEASTIIVLSNCDDFQINFLDGAYGRLKAMLVINYGTILKACSDPKKFSQVTCHFQPFIEACARYGNESLCRSFIEKLTNPVEVVESLLLLKKPVEAANYAADKKLLVLLEKIHLRYRGNKEVHFRCRKIFGMEGTPVSMLREPGNTATSQRRERRRERILRNSDQRIKSILSGPDGTEIRNAPALEGGEGFKDFLHSSEISVRNKNNGEGRAISKSIASSPFLCASVNRLWKALLIGLIMRLAVSFLLIRNIVWPWIILYMVSVYNKFFQFSSLFDADGHIFRSRLHLGFNVDFLSHAGAIVQNIRCFIRDSLAVALSFILFNAFFCVFALIFGKCCSF